MLQPQPEFEAYFSFQLLTALKKLSAHAHEGFELLYITEGEMQIRIRGRDYTAVAGDLVIYYPGETHEEHIPPGRYNHICLRFPGSFISPQVTFPGKEMLEPVFNLPWKERFRAMFEQIVMEHNGIDQYSRLLVGTYLIQLVALLRRALSYCRSTLEGRAEEKGMRISTAIEIINNKIDLGLSLKELAGKVYMSESRFSHVFKDVVGVPPRRYVIKARMEKAREMLLLSDQTVTEIALTLGYDNPAYFSRLFKKRWGASPAGYRAAHPRRKVQ